MSSPCLHRDSWDKSCDRGMSGDIPRGLDCSFVLYLEPNFYPWASRRKSLPDPQYTERCLHVTSSFITSSDDAQSHTMHVTHLVQHQTLPLLSGHHVTVIPFVYALDRYGCLYESMSCPPDRWDLVATKSVRLIDGWNDNRLSLVSPGDRWSTSAEFLFFFFILRDKAKAEGNT
jgi:hypothetical protein